MQSTIQHNLRNHSKGFISAVQAHIAYKSRSQHASKERSLIHKKTISKARHARGVRGSEYINCN